MYSNIAKLQINLWILLFSLFKSFKIAETIFDSLKFHNILKIKRISVNLTDIVLTICISAFKSNLIFNLETFFPVWYLIQFKWYDLFNINHGVDNHGDGINSHKNLRREWISLFWNTWVLFNVHTLTQEFRFNGARPPMVSNFGVWQRLIKIS